MAGTFHKKSGVIIILALLCLFYPYKIKAQTLTIYTIPAPHQMRWESPGKLVFSYLRNFLTRSSYGKYRHPIGHMMVELKDSTKHVIAGVRAVKNSGMTRKVSFNGYGLGILFEKIQGKLDETDINLPDIQRRSKNGDIAFLEFSISQAVFDRLWNYYNEYKEKGYHKLYNGLNQPLEGEGAGCSAFAFSFLEAAGLLDMIPPEICRIDRTAPHSLVYQSGHKEAQVSLFKVLMSRSWSAENDAAAPLYSTYEPTWLFNWIKRNHTAMPDKGKVQKTWLNKAPGILIDCSDQPVPQGPVWKN